MLYSVKMRSAQGGPHEQGGRHISGAERILSEEKIEQAIVAMLHRAQKHQRGMADFISLKVEAVKTADIFYRPLLPLSSCQADSVMAGRKAAAGGLVKAGGGSEGVPQAHRRCTEVNPLLPPIYHRITTPHLRTIPKKYKKPMPGNS